MDNENYTPQSTQLDNKSKRKFNLHIAWGLVVLLLVAALGYFMYANSQQSSRVAELETELEQTQQSLEDALAEASEDDDDIQEDETSGAESGAPYVLIRPGLIPDNDKKLLEERLVNPLIDHYEMNENRDVASVTVTRLADEEIESSNDEHYTITIVLDNGERPSPYEGFIYGKGGEIPHWHPVSGYIDDEVELTDEWKQKYPESAQAYKDSHN